MKKSLNLVCLALGLTIGVFVTLFSMPANAFGFATASVQYHSGSNNNVGAPVIVRQYPNGRVEVIGVPVTHVYPHGESLIYQNGGERVYSTGYGGAATCYVDCWHNGVNPNNNSGSSFSIGVGVHKTW
jgi:hypothetical protein